MLRQNTKTVKTSTLLQKLFKTPDLDKFMKHYSKELEPPQFHCYISQLCSEQGQVPERIIKQAAIDRTYGHQLFNGTRRPSRDKVIQLAFGFGLDVDGAQELLKAAQKSLLYPKIKRDAAILFCLSHSKSVIETQNVLEALGQTLLGGEEKHG